MRTKLQTLVRDTARQNTRETQEALKRNLRRAYQHILFLTQFSPDSPRRIVEVTLENDVETALNGTTVWKELAEKGKVFQDGQFSAKALLTNPTDNDYGRSLSELRDAFYQTPRLPLLPGGDNDLKSAIYFAVEAGDLRLVGADGVEKIVDAPDTINLSSQGLRLAKPLPAEACTKRGRSDCEGSCTTYKACAKWGKSDCDGTCPCPQCGKSGCDGTCTEPPVTKQEAKVRFTMVTAVGEQNRGATVILVESLFSGLADGQITFLSGTVQLVTTMKNAEEIRAAAELLGVVLTVKPTT